VTLLVGGPLAAVAFVGGSPWAAVPGLLVGIVVDAVLALRPSTTRHRVLAVTTAAPTLVTVAYLVAVHLTSSLAWSVHLVGGAVYLAGCVGTLVGVLATGDGSTVRSESI
jgi:hypothetical protein